jgi:hypothetical protein
MNNNSISADTYGRSFAGIAGSNIAGDMDVCLVFCVCVCDRIIHPLEESYELCLIKCDSKNISLSGSTSKSAVELRKKE